MAGEFKINKQAIRKMTQEIEKEIAKNPVRVPLEADPTGMTFPATSVTNNYHGPVVTVNGDNAQLAWRTRPSTKSRTRTSLLALRGWRRCSQGSWRACPR